MRLMRRKALTKDFCMEIKKSLGRFLSILFIVAIGVAFFSGIRSAEPDMKVTGDAYFDAGNLMDIKVISTLGLTEDDIAAIQKVDGVADVTPGYMTDVLCTDHDSQKVLHAASILPDMNKLTVSEGRLPTKKTECFVDEDFLAGSDYKVGDQITFTSGTKDPLSDALKSDTYTIVGSGSSPCYIAIYRGSSTIGTGQVSGFVYVPEEAFAQEVYSEIYVTVDGAKGLTAFTEAYDDCVENVQDKIDEIKKERQDARYQEIIDDADKELADAKKELADARKEADEKLADAQAKIDDGNKQLNDGKEELADAKQKIADSKAELVAQQQKLSDGQTELNDSQVELDENIQTLNESIETLEDGQEELNANKADVDAQYQITLDAAYATADNTVAEQFAVYLNPINENLALLNMQYDNETDENVKAAIKAQIDTLEQQKLQVETQQSQAVTEARGIAKAQVDAGFADGWQQIADAQAEIDCGWTEIAEGQVQLADGQAQIAAAQEEINSGQLQINDGWAQIAEAEQELADGEIEIAENEQKLKDAQAEYNDKKAEADKELADADKKIADAEDEVSKIERAKWYIYDRGALTEYDGFGENADRMRAIGQVFPVLFFLVAALISLTSMTRMVEEQRTQIGTLKALGYSRTAISAKYLGYAFLATVGGSVIGVLIGEKVLPYIIVYAYGIMYPHINDIKVPYNMDYAYMATGAAMICTIGATFFACYKELLAQAAELMRPAAPKNGKRVFMERVTFIWKRLSFIWKATIRNLIRYKKRFFMTVFGIGGSMALLLVGFGIKDSIFDIAILQYDQLQVYDGTLIMEEDASEAEIQNTYESLLADKKVDRAARVLMESVTAISEKKSMDVYLDVPKDVTTVGDYLVFRDRVSHKPYQLDDNGIVLTEKAATLMDVKAGDTIRIKDDVKGELEVKIEAVCENYLQHYIYMTPALYEKLYGQSPDYNAVYFELKDFSQKNLQEVGETALTRDGTLSVSYTNDVQGQLDDMLGSLNIVLVVLVISAGMLAFVVLYNLNNINITERQRELATIKVLGFYDKEVSAYVYRENILLTIIGAGAGAVLGRILHRFIIVTVEIDNCMFGRNIDFSSYIYSVLITFAFSAFVNWVMYYKLKKIDMVESLKSVE